MLASSRSRVGPDNFREIAEIPLYFDGNIELHQPKETGPTSIDAAGVVGNGSDLERASADPANPSTQGLSCQIDSQIEH